MKIKKILIIFMLFMVLICGVSAISAASDNTADNIMSETDSGDDSVSLSNNERAIGADDENFTLNAEENEYELNTQSQNEILTSELTPSGKTFNDIQNVIKKSKDKDVIKLSGNYTGSGKAISLDNKALTFCGENNATLDARNLSGIFDFEAARPVTITNIKFINYKDTSILSLGVYSDSSTLTLVNCTFIGNNIARGIYSYNTKCFISDCIFINNSNENCGGAINAHGSVISCKFINNSAGFGGALNAIENVTDCIFINNSATWGGSAINYADYVVNCSFTGHPAYQNSAILENVKSVEKCSFVNNTAYSGCIVEIASITECSFINNTGCTIRYSDSIVDCSFINNRNSECYDSKFIKNCSFIGNKGSIIYKSKSITDCIFINNAGKPSIQGENPNITACTFINSTAGAIYIPFENSHIKDCTFINSTADYGGAVYIGGDESILNNCIFINSTADKGGAVYIGGADCIINNCKFIKSTADKGGAIYCQGINALVNNTLFSNNKLDAVHSEYEIFIENYTLINQTKEDLNLIEAESKINATFSVSYSDTYFRFRNFTVTLSDSLGNPIRNQRILIELSNSTKTRMTTDSNGQIMYTLSGFGVHNLTFSSRSNIYNISEVSLNNVEIERYEYLTPNGQTTDDIQYILDNSYKGDIIKLQGNYITSKTAKLKITTPIIIEGDESSEFDSEFLGFEIYSDNVTVNIHSNIHRINGNAYSNISIVNCLFANHNQSSAVENCHNLTIINCSFVNNTAYEGGAISSCKNMKIYNSTFINNSATYEGGAIHLNGYIGLPYHGTDYLFNCSFIGNSASGESGVISNMYSDDDWVIEKCCFINNSAESYGVAFRGYYNNCSFINNYAENYATLDYYNNAVNCSFIDNKDKYPLNNVFKLTLNKKEFIYNSANTLDVKITADPRFSESNLYIAVGKSIDIENFISETRANSPGIGHLKISTLSVGTYYVYAYRYVDMDSTIVVGSAKIKINKAKPSLSAPKVTAKYKKSKYFKVTVKLNKKALKNLKIKIKVYTGKKYKTYTVKTDKKGIAKINTNKLKKGTHKVVINSGNSNYYISKNSQIKIK